jgi:hypothetical protein
VAIVSVVTLSVTDPGPQADAILDCLGKKVGEVDDVDDREYEITLTGAELTATDAVARVTTALDDCDANWQDCIALPRPI